jgi:hypothetical protein
LNIRSAVCESRRLPAGRRHERQRRRLRCSILREHRAARAEQRRNGEGKDRATRVGACHVSSLSRRAALRVSARRGHIAPVRRTECI